MLDFLSDKDFLAEAAWTGSEYESARQVSPPHKNVPMEELVWLWLELR